ncbi:hypothetical protein [Streptomyces sp. NPDC054940]
MDANQRNYGLYAVAVAISVVGALALRVPVATLSFMAIALACPLMMISMMRGMYGGGGMHGGHADGLDAAAPSGEELGAGVLVTDRDDLS